MAKLYACLVLIICLVVTNAPPPHAEAAITCDRVLSFVSPCLHYVQRGGPVPISCCDGIKSLNNAAATTPDIQAACRCYLSFVPRIGANPTLVNSLPGICHINVPYRYSPSLDCSKVVR